MQPAPAAAASASTEPTAPAENALRADDACASPQPPPGDPTPAAAADADAATPMEPLAPAVPSSSVTSGSSRTSPLGPLTGRMSIPLPIPIATDLVRKPKPQYGVEALGLLCRQPLQHQKRHALGAIQAIVSREGSIASCQTNVSQLTGLLTETDQLMAQLVDDMGRLDLVLAAAARPSEDHTRSGWVSLKPMYQVLVAAQARVRQQNTFRAGLMADLTPKATPQPTPQPTPHATPMRPSMLSPATPAVPSATSAASVTSPQVLQPTSQVSAALDAAAPSPALTSGPSTSTGSTGSAAGSVLHFRPVPVQQPICRHFLKNHEKGGSCNFSAAECPNLHVFESDCKPFRAYATNDIADANERAIAMSGVPYILYHLAVGEEAQYSLFRRTLDQHAPFMRRTLNLRHALLHWSPSVPTERFQHMMRPECRTLHFPHFTQLTHKHRFQSCIRKTRARIEAALQQEKGTSEAAAALRRKLHAFDFYPRTLLLPSDRLEFLDLHRSLGGSVAAAVLQEALHPADQSRKAKRKEKRSQQVGDVIIAPTASPPAAEPEDEPSTSPVAVANGSRWMQIANMPDFLAEFPLHFASTNPADAAAPTSSTSLLSSSSSSPSSVRPLPPPIWILKPYSRGGGHGIRITDFAHHVELTWITDPFVVTEYIQRPLLIDKQAIREEHERNNKGDATSAPPAADASTTPSSSSAPPSDLRKFDLRLYVLLLSPHFPPSPSSTAGDSTAFPFQVLLYSDGLARFASHPYSHERSTAPDHLGTKMDAYTHLTNNNINGTNHARGAHAKGTWENCDLDTLRQHFQQQRQKAQTSNGERMNDETAATPASVAASSSSSSGSSSSVYSWCWSYVWQQVKHLVLHSVCVSDDYLSSGLDPANRFAFELLGLDVLIDEEFRVHLCELNSMPDLNSSAPLMHYHSTWPVSHRVKSKMLADVFNILQLPAEGAPEAVAKSVASSSTAAARMGGFERLI